jgi:MFS family permease
VTGRRGLVWILGLGAFGLAFSITTTAAYLPKFLKPGFTHSNTVVAAILAAEGLFALTVPLVVGPWSDGFQTPMGRRRPFMLAALGPIGFCLAIVSFMPNIWTLTLIMLAFFFAYYVYEPPYRGLYPDVLHERVYGRSQGVQHVMRGIAIGIALVGGGFLFKAWHHAPFVFAAVGTTAACGACIYFVHEPINEGSRVFRGVRNYVKTSWTVFHEVPEVRRFLLANAAWEGTFAAMRTFVVLYITEGLDQPLSTSSEVLAAVAVGYVIAALSAGWLGDRFGLARVIFVASFVYGIGLLAAGLATEWRSWYFGFILPVAAAGGTVMTLAWALLFKLMPPQHRGAISGLATTTKGIGLIIGPLAAGIMIDVMKPYLKGTQGYEILWPVCAVPVLAAIPLVASLVHRERASGAPEPSGAS